MNAVERVLYQELSQLMDRLAATVPPGGLAAARTEAPTLGARLDDAESTLAAARTSLLDGYGRWGKALEDLENLWALAAWRSTAEDPAEKPGALAA
jgi:hypothetical protein